MSDFTDHLEDVFATLGPISARRMFGGYGVYHDGVMFGLVADDTLYLKADVENVGHFEEEGLPPFIYEKDEKSVKMSYYLAPDFIMDDPDAAAVWGRRSFEAGLRAQAARRKSGNGSRNRSGKRSRKKASGD